MDKKKLNNEIVLCRGAVRKAKVAVVRKFIKKMKILKSCKKEDQKEKKLRKSERLFKKIQIIKKLKDDDVTKFALKNGDLDNFLKETPGNKLRDMAMASLAKHKAVKKKINSLKESIPNWETELPLLLDSLGKKKKMLKKGKTKVKDDNEKKVEKKEVEENGTVESESCETKSQVIAEKVTSSQKGPKKKKESISLKTDKTNEEEKKKEVVEIPKYVKEEKVDDPFFISKKVIAPKLSQPIQDNKPNNKLEKSKLIRDRNSSIFHAKPFKVKKEFDVVSNFNKKASVTVDEKLHPSWAAKKVQLIKPFEGKKIKFDD